MVSTIDRQTWVEKARALEPEVAKWRDVGEEQRRLPAELFEAIKRAGLFRLALPRVYGGEQVDLPTFFQVIEEISRQDGSTGWNLMICSGGGCFADYLPEAAAREVFASGEEIAVGSFAPTGQAVQVDGGYRGTGRWGFGSGSQNATWLTGGFMLMEDGRPRMLAGGRPDIRILLFPAAQAEILDTWRTAGMRGTGSHDFQIEDVFIPENRGFPFWEFFRGPADRPGRAYSQPFLPHVVAPVMAGVALGIARHAIESFKTLAMEKMPSAATKTLAQQHTTHLRLGEAEALVRSARAYVWDVVCEVNAAGSQAPESIDELGAAVRLAAAHAVQSATRAVDLMFDAAGGSSIYASSPLERCFRDVHVVSHHLIVSPSNIEMVGQYLLGLGLEMRR